MRLISVQDLKAKIDLGEKILIIDIRDPEDFDYCHIDGSVNYPKQDFDRYKESIPMDIPVILVCKYGKKSEQLVTMMRGGTTKYNKVCSLLGGLWDWSREIDLSMTVW
ncbi:MAG: rhodanese-like domain-containing protein [Bacteroidetes bacterium]|nr:rhodanese-like domain-containing protein [Bacteroidota bacterium]